MSAFAVVKEFEHELCRYTGARFAVTTTSCTMAILLAVAYYYQRARFLATEADRLLDFMRSGFRVEIPKHTYVGVAYAIREAGGRVAFRDEDWGERGYYRLEPLPVVDSARYFTQDLYRIAGWRRGLGAGLGTGMVCVSFHWAKTLGIQQGGAILHDDEEADEWLRRARFDGRKEGVAPTEDEFPIERAWHAYMAPETAAAGLVRMATLPRMNAPIPPDNYPDLSTLKVFQ